jgi:hypothetical protein
MQNLEICQQENIADKFSKGVYFYCPPPQPPERNPYAHVMICLAEGLKMLGIPVYSNRDHWQISAEGEKKYLFKYQSEIRVEDCSVVVLDHHYFETENTFPNSLFRENRGYLAVYVDSSDGSITNSWKSEFRQFDVILKNHMLEGFSYPKNFHPWAFGLSTRMINYLQNSPDSSEREPVFHVNFRNSTVFQHSVRTYMYDHFLKEISRVFHIDIWDGTPDEEPIMESNNDFLYWSQTGRRHNPKYFQQLKNSYACACFSGFFVIPFPKDHSSKFSRFSKRILSKARAKTSIIVQWDNWRMWEAMAAGCICFQADFDKYLFSSPVKPENWSHYIGIDFDHMESNIERILDTLDELPKIAENGREWVLKNYSPLPTATRFLDLLTKIVLKPI